MNFSAYCPTCMIIRPIHNVFKLSNNYYMKYIGCIYRYLEVRVLWFVWLWRLTYAPVCCFQQREQSSSEPSGIEQGERSTKTSVVSYLWKLYVLSVCTVWICLTLGWWNLLYSTPSHYCVFVSSITFYSISFCDLSFWFHPYHHSWHGGTLQCNADQHTFFQRWILNL